ncbi:hypothetical protein Q8W30_10335 [Neptunomonas phycophila]|uniref:Transcriptional regulator VspR n=1 Tax=Neptunomonas phycophila TaxID=1572645 RepID=A0ABT9EV76_9GAMM|nr:hypothetical protein [Neptunomonas phycophila]MDP2522964.1 hypothetical protein [Neptunomonas phycophila]
MAIETTVANKKFLALLGCIHSNYIKRKDLITLVSNQLNLSQIQAEGFVARNIHKLQKRQGLITSSGKQGERTYHLLPPLLELISQNRQIESKLSDQDRLQQERDIADAELQILRGEIQAYNDLLTTYPDSRKEITTLIKEARDHAHRLNGRVNALEKVILAAN